MSIQMMATIKVGQHHASAPYGNFANNTKVTAYNKFMMAASQDGIYLDTIGTTEAKFELIPEITLSSKELRFLRNSVCINLYHDPIQHYSNEEVKELAAVLSGFKIFKYEALDSLFEMKQEDVLAIVDFFEICAANEYGISFS